MRRQLWLPLHKGRPLSAEAADLRFEELRVSHGAAQQLGTRATAVTRAPTARTVWPDTNPSGRDAPLAVSPLGSGAVPRPPTPRTRDASARSTSRFQNSTSHQSSAFGSHRASEA